ncbi:hypothetical protein ACVWZK_008390 [Bradyrhizobium sp. GM0.4]
MSQLGSMAEHKRIDRCVFWLREGIAVFGCEA